MPPINRIGGIVLAAGGSSRMGRAKQLLAYEGKTLLRRAAESAIAAEISPVVVVVNGDAGMVEEVEGLLVLPVVNGDWRKGMGTSVRAGMGVLERFEPLRGVVLMLCDQPLVTGVVLRRLVERFSRRASGIVAAAYEGTVGVPAVFGPEYFGELSGLADGFGAKGILERDRGLVTEVAVPEAGTDVDDAAGYANLIGVVPVEEVLGKSRTRSVSEGGGR